MTVEKRLDTFLHRKTFFISCPSLGRRWRWQYFNFFTAISKTYKLGWRRKNSPLPPTHTYTYFSNTMLKHRLLLLKLIQTDQWHHLLAISCNEQGIGFGGAGVPYWRGGAVHMPCWIENTTSRWLCVCVSSLNNICLCFQSLILFTVFLSVHSPKICFHLLV